MSPKYTGCESRGYETPNNERMSVETRERLVELAGNTADRLLRSYLANLRLVHQECTHSEAMKVVDNIEGISYSLITDMEEMTLPNDVVDGESYAMEYLDQKIEEKKDLIDAVVRKANEKATQRMKRKVAEKKAAKYRRNKGKNRSSWLSPSERWQPGKGEELAQYQDVFEVYEDYYPSENMQHLVPVEPMMQGKDPWDINKGLRDNSGDIKNGHRPRYKDHRRNAINADFTLMEEPEAGDDLIKLIDAAQNSGDSGLDSVESEIQADGKMEVKSDSGDLISRLSDARTKANRLKSEMAETRSQLKEIMAEMKKVLDEAC